MHGNSFCKCVTFIIDEDAEMMDEITLPDGGKVGAKKLAKLQAKAEKRANREVLDNPNMYISDCGLIFETRLEAHCECD